MDHIDVDKAYQLLMEKERAYDDSFLDYTRKKQELEGCFYEFGETRRRVAQLADDEMTKLDAFMKRHSEFLDTDIRVFFHKDMVAMVEESDEEYHRACLQLEGQLEELDNLFRQKRYQLQDEMEEARRQYVQSHS